MDRPPYEQAVDKDYFRILLLEPGDGNETVVCSYMVVIGESLQTSSMRLPFGMSSMECDHFQASGARPAFKYYDIANGKLFINARLVDSIRHHCIDVPASP